jgi:hypothetical protein
MDWQNQYCKNDYTTKKICMFKAISIKIPMTFFTEIVKAILKFIGKHKRPWIASHTEKNSNRRSITIPNFKQFYRAIAIKTAMILAQNRHEDQWSRTEDSEINPCIYSHLLFDKGTQNSLFHM